MWRKNCTLGVFDTKSSSLSYIFNICWIFWSIFYINFIVICCPEAQSQTEDVMEKISWWSLKQQTVLFFCKPKLNHHDILHSCIYLPCHAPCIFGDGWADHYEKQCSSQRAVIAFTELSIRGKMQHAPEGFTKYHVCFTHTITHAHSRNWSNLAQDPCRERGKQCQKQLKYRRMWNSEGMERWGGKSGVEVTLNEWVKSYEKRERGSVRERKRLTLRWMLCHRAWFCWPGFFHQQRPCINTLHTNAYGHLHTHLT